MQNTHSSLPNGCQSQNSSDDFLLWPDALSGIEDANRRPYQLSAATNLLNNLIAGDKPVGGAPTGSGKSYIIAFLIILYLDHYHHSPHLVDRPSSHRDGVAALLGSPVDLPRLRIIILAASKEIVSQNYTIFCRLFPEYSKYAGVFCAGLKRKDTDAHILFASAQSLFNAQHIVDIATLIVFDEADQHSYGNKRSAAFVARCQTYCGLTATPYRLHKGRTKALWGEGDDDE